MRLFIAFPQVPSWNSIQDFLRGRFPEPAIRWTHPSDLHLTLLFIGEVDPGRQADVSSSVSKVFSAKSPFTLEAESLTTWGDIRKPNMLWLRFRRSPAFTDLRQNLQEAIAPVVSLKPDYSDPIPHVTMARFPKGLVRPVESPVPEGLKREVMIDKAELWVSEARSDGRKYRAISEFSMRPD
jgi:2'-5' RNA ligase